MPFKKGQSGNYKGRPKGTNYRAKLEEALREAAKNHDLSPVKLFVEKAYTDNGLLKELMKKILPDLKFVEGEMDANLNVRCYNLGQLKDLIKEGKEETDAIAE